MKASKKVILFFLIILGSQQFSCKKDKVTPEKRMSDLLKEIVEKQNISRVIAADNQAFLIDLSFSEEFGFGFKFENNFVNIYGQSWNLAYLKRYEVVQRGNNFVLLLLFT